MHYFWTGRIEYQIGWRRDDEYLFLFIFIFFLVIGNEGYSIFNGKRGFRGETQNLIFFPEFQKLFFSLFIPKTENLEILERKYLSIIFKTKVFRIFHFIFFLQKKGIFEEQ